MVTADIVNAAVSRKVALFIRFMRSYVSAKLMNFQNMLKNIFQKNHIYRIFLEILLILHLDKPNSHLVILTK